MPCTAFMPQPHHTWNSGTIILEKHSNMGFIGCHDVKYGRPLFKSPSAPLLFLLIQSCQFGTILQLVKSQKKLSQFWVKMELLELQINMLVQNALITTLQQL